MSHAIKYARKQGCKFQPSGGKAGGFNIRYGNLGYSIMDITTDGTVFLHVNPDSGYNLSDEEREARNKFIEDLEGITVKNGPIKNYGQITESVEEIPLPSIENFIDFTVGHIRATFYQAI